MTEKEITLEEAKEEQKTAPPVKEDDKDVIDLIQPKIEPQVVVLELDGEEREYIQKPLSYFNKITFFSLVGETIDTALQTGLTVNDMMTAVPGGGRLGLQQQDFFNVDSFVMAISKITRYAPDFLKDCYCIWLNIPQVERAWAREALDNLSDEEGLDIIETFIDQNYEAIENFFRKIGPKIVKRIQSHRQANTNSTSSNNSKRTRRRTRKQ